MNPVPEPAGDIRAQIAATLDPVHPKRACFMVPPDAERFDLKALPLGAYAVVRDEGTLVTASIKLAAAFDSCKTDDPEQFDRMIAAILGYPEAKPVVVARCRGEPAIVARAVQARDADGHVIHEAYTSPVGFWRTVEVLQRHVSPGGRLVILSPPMAISRRVAMRWVEG